jgi:hypothetical protein
MEAWMPYRFATEKQDLSDYASGRVFTGAPGHPAFPVRLASEIFQRCVAARDVSAPCVLYDPVCGGAYHLSTLAYLQWHAIDTIIGSDIDSEILSVAERNLGLLTLEGLDRRIAEIQEMLACYGKASHAAALASANRLRQRLAALCADHWIATRLFAADALDGEALAEGLAGRQVDVVISDIPYGEHSSWQLTDPVQASRSPVWWLLEALRSVLAPGAVVAIAADKAQRLAHESYRRVDRFQIGKRQIVLLQPGIGGHR